MKLLSDRVYRKKFLISLFAASFIVIAVVTTLVIVLYPSSAYESHDLDHWTYDNQATWPGICKTGESQSPVALSEDSAFEVEMPALELSNFEECQCLEVENNGHSVVVRITEEVCPCRRPKLSGGGLNDTYTLDNLHFHWPSEHTIDNMGYDLEGHFVFYADKYKNFEEALGQPYGVTVLGVLYLVSNSSKSDNFRILADAVESVSSKAGTVTLTSEGVNLEGFLPYDHDIFFTYNGSLTTPACKENINWIVLRNHSSIAYLDLQDLTHIYDNHHKLLSANNRSLQDINGRTIFIRQATD